MHFRRIFKIVEWILALSCLSVRLSIRLSLCLPACNNSAPTRKIFITFEIWYFFRNQSRTFKLGKNLTRVMSSSHDHLCTFIIISPVFLSCGSCRPPHVEGRCEKSYEGYAVYGNWDTGQLSDNCSVNSTKKKNPSWEVRTSSTDQEICLPWKPTI